MPAPGRLLHRLAWCARPWLTRSFAVEATMSSTGKACCHACPQEQCGPTDKGERPLSSWRLNACGSFLEPVGPGCPQLSGPVARPCFSSRATRSPQKEAEKANCPQDEAGQPQPAGGLSNMQQTGELSFVFGQITATGCPTSNAPCRSQRLSLTCTWMLGVQHYCQAPRGIGKAVRALLTAALRAVRTCLSQSEPGLLPMGRQTC